MSNISGNTFFIENAINCSNLETINGNVSFLDTSSNCGQVLNAIFSGGINCGQAYGCTVFCNSCNYGYVCGTGILRGSSVLYGAADCVIQCDQSIIDAGASVAGCEFLVTTGIPTNIYSNDSAYYIYSNGVCTLATGGWSNFYFTSSGLALLQSYAGELTIQTGNASYAIAYQAQDNGLFYASDYCTSVFYCIADGAYYNGYFCSGYLDSNFCSMFPLNPRGIFFGENLAPNQFYLIYNSGTITAADGLLPRLVYGNDIFVDFFQTGFVSVPSTAGIKYISTLNGYTLLLSTTACVIAGVDVGYGCCQGGYVYCFTTPTGATSIGYFNLSCEGPNIYSFSDGTSKVIPIDTTFTCNSALQAQDDCSYYTYCTGGSIIANGFYSNYAITGGAIDYAYSTNMPTGAIDNGCQIYENGGAICVTGVNYILDNCRYYGEMNDLQLVAYQCGQPFAYKSNLCCFSVIIVGNECLHNLVNSALVCNGIFHFGYCSFTYSSMIDDHTFYKDERTETIPLLNNGGTYFLYCNGSGIIPNGIYSNYAFDNSISVNTAYTCTLPQITLDNCCYYVYSAGVAAVATGAFSNYYFEPAGIASTTCNIVTPTMAQDNYLYRTYCAGVAIIPQGCSYSNYYICYVDGSIDTSDRLAPSEAQDNIGYYYIYCTGIAILAPLGIYSNFVIDSNGQKCISFSTNYPTCAINNGLFYTYFEGGSNGEAAGLYSDHYYTNGCIDTIYTCTFPQITQDNCCYYVYDTGLAIGATGAYPNYYFEPAANIATTCFITTPIQAQNDCCYYIYGSGVAAGATGAFSNYYFEPAGIASTTFYSAVPLQGQDTCCYYLYTNGLAAGGAIGAYSNYYFEPAENIATTCCITTPIPAQNAEAGYYRYYLYTDGVAALAIGAFSNYYFEPAGIIATACDITPPISGLDNGLFYNYCTGISVLASGPYSNFAFLEGVICTTFQIVCTALDNSCVYKYTDGVAMYTVCAQGTNVGWGDACYYDVGACFQGGYGDGSITVAGDCCFLIGCNYCCADGADNCGLVYCAFGTYVCYCLFDAGSATYCIACCTAVNV